MKKLLLSLLLCPFVLQVMAQDGVMLKLNPEKNKVYHFKSITDQTVTQTINGNQQNSETKVNYVMSLKMVDQTPSFLVAEVRFDTISINTNAMGKVVGINSASEGNIQSADAGEVMSYVMNKLTKNTLFVKLDFSGQPLEIINQKMISDLILKDTSSVTATGVVGKALKSQMSGFVSESSLKTMIGMFTWMLPGKVVAKGEEWKTTQQTNSGGMTLDIITTFHLDNLKDNKAGITAEAVIKPGENAKPIKSAAATVTYDNLQGMSKTTILIDASTGLAIENNGKTHIAGDLSVSGPGFSMQMPMDINSESKVITLN